MEYENLVSLSTVLPRNDFFASKLGITIHCSENFNRLIVPELSPNVPAFEGILEYLVLSEARNDRKICGDISDRRILSADEAMVLVAAVICGWCEGMDDGCSNVVYLQSRTKQWLVIGACWSAVLGAWLLNAYKVSTTSEWQRGDRIFSVA